MEFVSGWRRQVRAYSTIRQPTRVYSTSSVDAFGPSLTYHKCQGLSVVRKTTENSLTTVLVSFIWGSLARGTAYPDGLHQ